MVSVFGGRSRGPPLAALLAAGLLACAGTAAQATPAWLRKVFATHLIPRPKAPLVARYRIESGGAFILDRSATRPLLRFDDNPEVFALTASRGPGGAVIYRNDVSEPMLRVNKIGGATVFTSRRPEGDAAAMTGAAAPIRLSPLGWIAFTQRLGVTALRARQVTQRRLVYEAPDADAGNDALIADAAAVTTEALADLAAKPAGRALFSHVAKVDFVTGPEPSASLRDGVLLITVTPALGLSGRPSSLRICQALGAQPPPMWIGVSR